MAIRIITDSTSDIPLDEAQNLGIEIAPLKVRFGSEEYVDKYTITNEQFYQKLSASDALPTTALVNPEYFIEMFTAFRRMTLSAFLFPTSSAAPSNRR
jgi:fatty acid-binding protein DegV